MQSTISLFRVILALAVGMSGSTLVFGTSLEEQPLLAETLIDIPMGQEVITVISGLGTPLAGGQLESYRGGFDMVKNDMQLSGSVANNSTTNVMSGSNSIADGAFTSSTGFPTVIQNSGSNVLIQNATIVNLQLQ